MIDYVHVQLSDWARSLGRDAVRGLGYPSVSPMFRNVKHGGVYGSAPPLGVTMSDRQKIEDTAAAVLRLGKEQRELVVEYYIKGGTAADVASRMGENGIAVRTLYDRLHLLHQVMLGLLNDVVAGVPALAAKVVDTRRTVSV